MSQKEMIIKNIKVKDGDDGYGKFIEVELDNGEYIFCNDYISNYKKIEKLEEANEEDFVVTNSSIMDVIDDDEKYEYMMCSFDKYEVEIKDVETYNKYLDTLLMAWQKYEGLNKKEVK
jgi:hypothetical protein